MHLNLQLLRSQIGPAFSTVRLQTAQSQGFSTWLEEGEGSLDPFGLCQCLGMREILFDDNREILSSNRLSEKDRSTVGLRLLEQQEIMDEFVFIVRVVQKVWFRH